MVAIALNLQTDTARDARVNLKGCGVLKGARLFTYAGEPRGFAEQQTSKLGGAALDAKLPPYSITVLDLILEPAQGTPGAQLRGRRPGAP